MTLCVRPAPSEYFKYYEKYVSLVPDGDIVETLHDQAGDTIAYLTELTGEQAEFRYAPGKWSVKECLGHLIDTERIFAYRALRIARNDKTPIEGFEQDGYVQSTEFDACALESLVAEFEAVRESTTFLLSHLSEEAWSRTGTASTHAVSVRALAYMIAGHELHHMALLRDKYFPQK